MGQVDVWFSPGSPFTWPFCALFAVQRQWRTPYHIEDCMNRLGRKRAFQRYLIRVCRPRRCWDRPVWANRGELCAWTALCGVWGALCRQLEAYFRGLQQLFLAISPLGWWSSSCHVKTLFVRTLALPRERCCRKKRAAVDLRPEGWKYQSRSQTSWDHLLALAASCCFCSSLLPLSNSPLFSKG